MPEKKKNNLTKKIAPTDSKYKNIALFPDDRLKLKEMATAEQRSMTRQMSVILKKEYARFLENDTV
jgi:hypothetical protein